jgi:hypothetical protein
MNEQNFKYLNDQIRYTGFGDDHYRELKEKIQSQVPEFTIAHHAVFGDEQAKAELYFKKSQQSDMYFFNRYALEMKNQNNESIYAQSFRISREFSITLKEGYNLMNGRAVYKEINPKEGEKYHVWFQLNLKETDLTGNFKMKQFHEKYGYHLQESLAKYPIKELSTEQHSESLLRSLERGNRQSVKITHEGKEQKMFIEANPQFKSLNIFNSEMLRVNLPVEKQSETQSETNYLSQVAEQKQDLKQEKKLSQNSGDDEEGAKKTQKQSRKLKQSQG